jgi:mannose-1-phosphate guanylyltransferase
MITPVILCGGSGNRLWPVSRASFPKQFAPLVGCETLFQKSALRSLGAEFTNPLVGHQLKFSVHCEGTTTGYQHHS